MGDEMADTLEKNLKCLEQARPFYYKKITEKLDKHEYNFEKFEYIETRDGNYALVVNDENGSHRLNSMYKPVKEAEKWAEQYNFKNLSVSVVMFGIGNGIFVNEMLGRLSDDGIVFLYEPDNDIFLYILHHADITDILSDSRVKLIVNGLDEEYTKLDMFKRILQREMHWAILPSQIVCFHPGYEKLYEGDYGDFLDAVHMAIDFAITNKNTVQYLSKQLINNVIKNLHFIKDSNYIAELKDKFPEGYPAIIVSAGPSLDNNIDELKRAEKKAFIIATDTAVKYLVQHNIKFDCVVSVDAKKGDWHLAYDECNTVPFFGVLDTQNKFYEKNTSKKIWIKEGMYLDRLYGKFGRIFPDYGTGGSVATSAFNICRAIGIKKIILIGQDLAYKGESTHAGDVKGKINWKPQEDLFTRGVDGEMVKTRYDWMRYKEWFESEIAKLEDSVVIDATEGGALIEGTEIMTLSDAIEKYCTQEFDAKAFIENMPCTFDEKEYKEVQGTLLHLRKEFANIKQKSIEGKKYAQELVVIGTRKEVNPAKESELSKKLRKINNFINKQSCYELIETYISDDVAEKIAKINTLSEDENENLINTANISIAIYEAMEKAIKELTPVLEESLEKV